MRNREVIIVGAGIAAMITALNISSHMNVKLFTKLNKGNSWRAQGGMAVVIDENDDPQYHFQDTLEAGCFHNDMDMVSILVNEGVSCVNKWLNKGMDFDRDKNGELCLGMEGAHTYRRILHAGGDQTGARWMDYLTQKVVSQSKIEVLEDEQVIDLIIKNEMCVGVVVQSKNGTMYEQRADATVLATGGCGGIFDATSNDKSIIGDGIVMAYRAGAQLSDLEFIQFHPTLIKYNGIVGLASEAIRGEGAELIDQDGRKIMKGVHPKKDLAPRDVVARVIEREVNRGSSIFLDISMIPHFKERFPAIYRMCEEAGLPLEEKRIPVTIGAHFLMGGVKTDANGCTTLPHLYAVGEVARTGVHGANRLASNSLLEGLVFAERTAEAIVKTVSSTSITVKEKKELRIKRTREEARFVIPSAKEIQRKASLSLGVRRDANTLKELIQWCESLGVKRMALSTRLQMSREEIDRCTMLTMTWLIASAALTRTESRGGHFRMDFPLPQNEKWQGVEIIVEKDKNIYTKRSGGKVHHEQILA
ncbi:L-aspartate oxidase [Evansella cellulosilytica]|uniref:L-aspartate oxidase n=1 Tax=Evansella cellulosilytica (strain ATCC 21833 / DSM 2522 / FERM P-1141 / JCM 9156 / N-4) TaxID=649639 RepID=E6TUE3_EVAC2|nr:L-aspartate oxidase [Evansella cellulosilytica]ADU29699.1 L-aspartate oxidase [Evansella cellulosilytica DSM 2522]